MYIYNVILKRNHFSKDDRSRIGPAFWMMLFPSSACEASELPHQQMILIPLYRLPHTICICILTLKWVSMYHPTKNFLVMMLGLVQRIQRLGENSNPREKVFLRVDLPSWLREKLYD